MKVDLSIRTDTGRINSSPTTVTMPTNNVIQGCNHTIVIPGRWHGCYHYDSMVACNSAIIINIIGCNYCIDKGTSHSECIAI